MIEDGANESGDGPGGERPARLSWAGIVYRWLLGIGAVAAAVFGGVYLVYSIAGDDGAAVAERGGVPLIRAAQGPVKVRPADPGGRVVPHQNRQVYREYDTARHPARPHKGVEDLLAPGSRQSGSKQTSRSSARNAAAAGPTCRADPALRADVRRYRRTVLRAAAARPAPPDKAAGRQAASQQAAARAPAEPATAGPPIRSRPRAAPAAAPKAVAGLPKPAGRTAPAATAPPFRIQLGAFRTLAKARRRGRGLQQAHRSLLGRLNMTVERVDLGAKGIFYRLRAGPLPDRQSAHSLCRSLGKRRIDCYPVRG